MGRETKESSETGKPIRGQRGPVGALGRSGWKEFVVRKREAGGAFPQEGAAGVLPDYLLVATLCFPGSPPAGGKMEGAS